MIPLQIPNLSTLDQLPSWCNLKGNIDRSACIEVRLAEVRELAGCIGFHQSKSGTGGRWRTVNDTLPLPDEQPALRDFRRHIKHGTEIIATRLATGIFTIDARTLHELHERRMPRQYAGDLRTNRAHVMREENFDPKPRRKQKPGGRDKFLFRNRVSTSQPFAYPYDLGLDANPNKGAARSKMIGLSSEWSQPIRIEKWTFPRRIQPAYYLICPGVRRGIEASRDQGIEGRRKQSPTPGSTPLMPGCLDASMPPPLSTRPPGREHPSTKKCPQRTLKLLMVQCTRQENEDAQLAQLWLNSLPPRLRFREPYFSHINKLIARYGPIFEPRTLLCPRCLKVRYGNNPETVRQGWRRRNHKPDTSIKSPRNLSKLKKKRLNHWEKIEMDFVMMKREPKKRCARRKRKLA